MKKSLLASTLIAATALAVPAFADDDIALLATDGITPLASLTWGKNSGLSFTNNSNGTNSLSTEFADGSYLIIDATSTWTCSADLEFDSGSEITLSVNVGEDGTNSARLIISGSHSVSISTGTSITLTIDISELSDDVTEFTVGIISGGSYTFDDGKTASDLNLIAKFVNEDGSVDTSWDYDYSVAVDSNGLSLVVSRSATAIPEPSMFGILFGLGAISLVATRRRRRA